jgi:hypothetical protein
VHHLLDALGPFERPGHLFDSDPAGLAAALEAALAQDKVKIVAYEVDPP